MVCALIVSHNTRIQCLLNLIKASSSVEAMKAAKSAKNDKIRFKNCAIIRIEITEIVDPVYKSITKKVWVKLVYSGELGKTELKKLDQQPYYLVKEEIPEYNQEQQIDGHLTHEGRFDTSSSIGGGWYPFKKAPVIQNLEVPLDDTYTHDESAKILRDLKLTGSHVFYIVRHGQAEHNSGGTHTKLDTNITTEGMGQAVNAGYHLLEILKHYNEIPEILFVSDLKRTRLTMNLLVGSAIQNACVERSDFYERIRNLNKEPFVVLPCASELSILSADGNCDQANADAPITSKLAQENYPSCTFAKIETDPECKKETNPPLDLGPGSVQSSQSGQSGQSSLSVQPSQGTQSNLSSQSDESGQPKCPIDINHRLDWQFYLEFYGGRVRNEPNPPRTNKRCRDTNMLEQAIRYWNTTKGATFRLGGKTKRKRKTRKLNRRK